MPRLAGPDYILDGAVVCSLPLTKGAETIIDAADRAFAEGFCWHLTTRGYAARSHHQRRLGLKRVCYLHRELMGASEAAHDVDHINGNPLDNRRSNLRIVSHQENMQNLRGANSRSRTGLQNVYALSGEREGQFQVQVRASGRTYTLGLFSDPDEAARVAEQGRRLLQTGHPQHVSDSRQLEAFMAEVAARKNAGYRRHATRQYTCPHCSLQGFGTGMFQHARVCGPGPEEHGND